jgi:hypothetical protein
MTTLAQLSFWLPRDQIEVETRTQKGIMSRFACRSHHLAVTVFVDAKGVEDMERMLLPAGRCRNRSRTLPVAKADVSIKPVRIRVVPVPDAVTVGAVFKKTANQGAECSRILMAQGPCVKVGIRRMR